MDSGLSRLAGDRLRHLRYSDAPRVAQAILDNLSGANQVTHGLFGTVPFVKFVRPGVYSLAIRGDDWRKIFLFLRYGSGSFKPVFPPANPPPPIPARQPNRVEAVPYENPGQGITNFFGGLPYDQYVKLQGLLTASRIYNGSASVVDSYVPTAIRHDGLDDRSFNSLVDILQQVFPVGFPTRV